MRNIDFSSWSSILIGLASLMLVTLIGMGLRLVMMMTIQQRRERMNRQINERLRTLIAAYRTLGGSFTGDLVVDPRHLRELRQPGPAAGNEPEGESEDGAGPADPDPLAPAPSESAAEFDRPRRIRDAVESALADIILLGTEQQVRLAEQAARELVAGRPIHVHDLAVSLRDFIREALDLAPIPADIDIPRQGPVRPSGGGRGGGKGGGGREGGGKGQGGGGGGGMGMGMGMGAGAGLGLGASEASSSGLSHHGL